MESSEIFHFNCHYQWIHWIQQILQKQLCINQGPLKDDCSHAWLHSLMVSILTFNWRDVCIKTFWMQFFATKFNEFMNKLSWFWKNSSGRYYQKKISRKSIMCNQPNIENKKQIAIATYSLIFTNISSLMKCCKEGEGVSYFSEEKKIFSNCDIFVQYWRHYLWRTCM